MKFKTSIILLVAALVTVGMSGVAFAFHNGGVAACESCHTMHNSKDGAVMSRVTNSVVTNNLVVGQAGAFLLQGTDQSSTCLNCHGVNEPVGKSYHVLSLAQTVPTERTPGGDFAWLRKGSKKGHSIVAADYGLTAETTKAGNVAPGSDTVGYPVASLNCASCHDPHGKYRKLSTGGFGVSGEAIAGSGSYGVDPTNGEAVGSYRLLGGMNYLPKSMAAFPTLAFSENPMSAAAPNTYNATEATNEVVVNYGDSSVGMWCQQCHPKMHMAGLAINVHPNDQAVGATIAGLYNAYVKTGLSDGSAGSGYTSLVPVAYDNINQNSQLAGHFTTGAQIASSDRVMCLSCHRAHASGFDYMLRFPIVEVMTTEDAGQPTYWAGGTKAATVSTVSGLTVAELQAALYDRPATKFAIEQRTLCNKCHAKD